MRGKWTRRKAKGLRISPIGPEEVDCHPTTFTPLRLTQKTYIKGVFVMRIFPLSALPVNAVRYTQLLNIPPPSRSTNLYTPTSTHQPDL